MKITAAQFDQVVDSLPQQYRANMRGAGRKQFADNLVNVLLLSQEGKRRKLDENPAYKTQAFFQQANILASLTFEELTKNAKPDEAELRKYFEEHRSEFEQVKARHILIRMAGSAVPVKPGQKDLTEAEALAKAQELRKKIADGEDFAKLATAESDDAGSGKNGGDLGFFTRGRMVPAFEQTAFTLKPGEVSEPVKSPFGYHIIKVEARESKKFEDVRQELENKMRPGLNQKILDSLPGRSAVVLDPEFFGVTTK